METSLVCAIQFLFRSENMDASIVERGDDWVTLGDDAAHREQPLHDNGLGDHGCRSIRCQGGENRDPICAVEL